MTDQDRIKLQMEYRKGPATVSSVGVTNRGNVAATVVYEGRAYSVAINAVDFAKLAEAGVPVANTGDRH